MPKIQPLLFAVFAACAGPDAQEPVDTSPATPCGVSVLSWPFDDGASDVAQAGPYEVVLSADDGTATLTANVPGVSYRRAGAVLGFVPDAPIADGQPLTLTATTCDGASSRSATVGTLGTQLDVEAQGLAFDIDLASVSFARPAGFGTLAGLLPDLGTTLRVGVPSTAPDAADTWRFALTTPEGDQDPCGRTLDVEGGSQTRGWLSLRAERVSMPFADLTFDLQALSVDVALSADGTAIEAGRFSTLVAVEGLAALWAGGDLDAACSFFGNLNLPCIPCAADPATSCLAFDATQLSGTSAPLPASITAVDPAVCGP